VRELSLIIPTHNRAAWLPATIASARAAAPDAEIIVVDDASTDETAETCRLQGGVRYIHLAANGGTAAARNAGIRASDAEFIAFLDDDDLRLPGSLEPQLKLLRANAEAAFVYGRAFLGDPRFSLATGSVVPETQQSGDIFWTLLEGNFVPAPTVVARRRCLLEVGLFDENLRTMEDYDLWVRLAERFPVLALPTPVALYRARSDVSGQKTSDRATHEDARRQLVARMLRTPRALAAPRSWRRRARRLNMRLTYNSLIHDAATAVVKGDLRAARSSLGAAVRLHPLHLKAHISLVWLLGRSLVHKLS
jgi:glycosyltransferase involved in cell wall biosynthesis